MKERTPGGAGESAGAPRRQWIMARLKAVEGAQLYEFAMILPMLAVLTAGIMDFATGYHLKQRLTNAAREGARLGANQPTSDLSQTTPASIQVIRDTVVTYLANANVDTSFISATMSPCGTFRCWSYYSTGTIGLKIERYVAVPAAGGGTIPATRITLTYPYNWTYGFDRWLNLGSNTITISTAAVMPNSS